MTDLERVRRWFDTGRLVRPSADVINFVDLVRALAHLTGAEDMETGPGVKELCRKIGHAENYIFVLVDDIERDGFGTDPVLYPAWEVDVHTVAAHYDIAGLDGLSVDRDTAETDELLPETSGVLHEPTGQVPVQSTVLELLDDTEVNLARLWQSRQLMFVFRVALHG